MVLCAFSVVTPNLTAQASGDAGELEKKLSAEFAVTKVADVQ